MRTVLSYTLWRGLFHRMQTHPMYWRPLSDTLPPITPQRPYTPWQRVLRWLAFAGGLIVLVPILALLLFPGTFLLMLAVLAGGTIAGLQTAYGVASLLGREFQAGRGTLLGATPYGPVGLSWALAARFIRRDKGSRQFRRLVTVFYLFAAVGVLLLGVGIVLMNAAMVTTATYYGMEPGSPGFETIGVWTMVLSVLNGLLIVTLLLIDTIQSVLTGTLIGMSALPLAPRRDDARLAALGVFLLVQLGFYVLVLLVGISLPGALYTLLGLEPDLLLSVIRVGVVLGLRELLLHLLWQGYIALYNADDDELRALIRA